MITVCLLLANENNRQLIREMLCEQYTPLVAADSLPPKQFDLCITDGVMADKLAHELRARKASESPKYLPILLLTSLREPDLFTRNWWEILDDVLELPVHKAVLCARIGVHVRMRNQSLELFRQNVALSQANKVIQQHVLTIEKDKRVLDTILEHIPLGVVVADYPDTRFTAMSRFYRDLSGGVVGRVSYERAAKVGMHPLGKSISQKEELPLYRALELRQVVSNEEWVIEKDAQGRTFTIQVNAAPILRSDGRVEGAVLIWLDVTAYKRIEQELRESEEYIRLANRAAGVAVFEWDIRNNRNRSSPELEAMYGLPPGAFPETIEAWQQLIYKEDRARVISSLNAAIDKGGKASDEWRVVLPNGSIRWLYGRSYLFKDAAGKPERLVGVNIDITERKQAEEQLRMYKERLEFDLDAMTRLRSIASLYMSQGTVQGVLDQIVEAAVAIARADGGSLQLLDDKTNSLILRAHRGMPQAWVNFWDTVVEGQGAGGAAFLSNERVIEEDITAKPGFAGKPSFAAQLEAGIRAVQSTPIINRQSKPIGLLSTYLRSPGKPDEHTFAFLDLLVHEAAEIFDRVKSEEILSTGTEIT